MWRRTSNLRLLLLRRPLSSAAASTTPPPTTTTSAAAKTKPTTTSAHLARSIARELKKLSSPSQTQTSSLDVGSRFSLRFPDVSFNTSLLREVLAATPASASGRPAADLFRHIVTHRSFHPSDSALSLIIRHLSLRHDFKPALSLLSEFHETVGPLSHSAVFLGLSQAGRPTQAIKHFSSLPPDHRNYQTLSALISALAENGFAGHAERIIMQYANEIFPDESICTSIIRGYCVKNKLEQAIRLLCEVRRGGFELSTPAYNSILDCGCRLARKKDPLSLSSEANKFLIEMESVGIPRDSETFRVLITNFCKIRKTEDAMKLFRSMSQWGCSPDPETYIVLIRSLYEAGRLSEGDEMIGFMRSAGFGNKLELKVYHGILKILCGIERVEHAVKVFRLMKGYGISSGKKTYSLLIEKLATRNLGDKANALFREAVARGVPVEPGTYQVDQRFVKSKKVKKVKKRLTLPEKMIKKSKKLYKLKMSFVRKSKSRMSRRYA